MTGNWFGNCFSHTHKKQCFKLNVKINRASFLLPWPPIIYTSNNRFYSPQHVLRLSQNFSRPTQRDGSCSSPPVSPSQQPRCPYILLLSKILTITEPCSEQSRLQELKRWHGEGEWSDREEENEVLERGGILLPGGRGGRGKSVPWVRRPRYNSAKLHGNSLQHTVGLQYCQPYWNRIEGRLRA